MFAPEPVNVTEDPEQIVFVLALAVTVGAAFTVTVVCAVPVHPFAAVPVTVYVWVALGVKATPLDTPLFHV